jgi:hypothetical protein
MGAGTNSMKAKAYSVLLLPYRYNMECAIRMQAISGSIQCAISYTQYAIGAGTNSMELRVLSDNFYYVLYTHKTQK